MAVVVAWISRFGRSPKEKPRASSIKITDYSAADAQSPARAAEKDLYARFKGKCTKCERWFPEGEHIFWNSATKEARHFDCEAARQAGEAREAERAKREAQLEQEKAAKAFQKLLDRVTTAKSATTRRNVLAAAEEQGVTPQQRLTLLLEASKLDTDDTLEKVESLKSKAVKRRRLEETLAMIRGDAVPDEMQTEQIALLEEALRTLDGDPKS
jgi:hypothetical protein